MNKKEKNMLVETIFICVFAVSVGTITNYSLVPTILAGLFGWIVSAIFIKIKNK